MARPQSAKAPVFASKRGRPTADQAEAITRAIMTAAAATFLAEGYEGASVETIAARAGVPKSTLYKRYPEKKELLRAVLRERLSAWSVAEDDHRLGDDLETRLKHYAATMVVRALSQELRAVFGLIASAWGGPDQAGDRRDLIGYTCMLDRLEQEIRDYGPAQGIQARHPRRTAAALMAMLHGWLQWDAPSEGDVEAAAVRFSHAAVEMLMAGSAAW